MANTVKHKRSNVAAAIPTPLQVAVGELAINFADKKLYTQEPGGTIIELGGASGGGSGTVTNVATGTGLTGGPITSTGTVSIANTGVTSGTYQGLTINAQGQVTSASDAGYVVGPATATDNAVTRFDLTTGKLVQNSLVTIDDVGLITTPSDIAVNGGDLTTTATTFNLLNATATTVNIAGAGTTVEIGAATGTTSVNNSLTVDGNTTFGDASTDTITSNASTMSIPNNLNIDSNTMFLDAANDRVAIGAATAGAKLDVQASTTVPAVRITQTGTGDALLIEDAASVDASPFVVNQNGQVGVGIASPATNAKVDVNGTATQNFVTTTGTMDLSAGQVFTATVAAATTFAFSNPPASRSTTAVLHLTNGGAAAVTWNAAIKWPSATAPTLSNPGIDVLVFHTVDGGATWRGNIFGKDIK